MTGLGSFPIRARALALGLTALPAATALAESDGDDRAYPYVDGEVVIEIQNDYTFQSDDPDAELNDLFTTTEPEVRLHLLPGLRLVAHGVLEPVRDPQPGRDRYFDDHGLFLEELYAAYDTDLFGVKGGKYNAAFGIAWDAAPGIYGVDFAEDYELTERIGVGAHVNINLPDIADNTVSTDLFFQDTSPLSEAIIVGRGPTRLSDGGPSNTEKLNSFSIALDGSPAILPDLSYHVSVVDQARGRGDAADELGVAIAGQYTIAVGEVEVMPLVEYVHFNDSEGRDGVTRNYLTTGVGATWREWNVAVSRTSRTTHLTDGSDVRDSMVQVSAGYEFDFGLTADVGWRYSNEEDIEQHIFGALLTYTFAF